MVEGISGWGDETYPAPRKLYGAHSSASVVAGRPPAEWMMMQQRPNPMKQVRKREIQHRAGSRSLPQKQH